MGGHTFTTRTYDEPSADQAFRVAIEEARAENGHRDGYSGDIQTCRGFVMVIPHEGETADACIDRVLDRELHGITKWGKAGCIKTPDGFLFFGWGAS